MSNTNMVDLVELKKQLTESFKKEHSRNPTRRELRVMIKRYDKSLVNQKKQATVDALAQVKIFPVGHDNIMVTLSSEAMTAMRRGTSFPINMISGDKTVRFVFMEEQCYLKTTKQFIDKTQSELKDREELEQGVAGLSQSIADKSNGE